MTDPAEVTESAGITEPEVIQRDPGNGEAGEVETPAASREAIDQLATAYGRMRTEIGKSIVGQHEVVDQLLVALFSGGHCLLEGVPGLAKTLLVSTIAEILELSFRRIQFTPDLMPSDITGTDVLQDDPETHQRAFHFMRGPLFANIVLADEINRTPPKTQAALLEAMQERRVTVGTSTYPLPQPFFVLATQNPIEQEGTYTLPEAQLDRFMFHVIIEHPPEDEEMDVVRTTTVVQRHSFQHAVTGADLVAFQELIRKVPVSEAVLRYALSLVRTSRSNTDDAPEFVKKWVAYGASVRAAQYLILGGKARAVTQGRYHVNFDDIRALAHPVMRHRVLLNFHAESEGITSDQVVDQLLEAVPMPASQM